MAASWTRVVEKDASQSNPEQTRKLSLSQRKSIDKDLQIARFLADRHTHLTRVVEKDASQSNPEQTRKLSLSQRKSIDKDLQIARFLADRHTHLTRQNSHFELASISSVDVVDSIVTHV